MKICDKCGQSNDANYQFCRNCGSRIALGSRQNNPDHLPQAPRPYAWKTDEYETQAEPRPQAIQQPFPQRSDQYGGQMVRNFDRGHLAENYRCGFCGSNQLPMFEKQISSTGWVIFSLLLVFTVVFFWIGLLFKEEVRVCPNCRNRVG